MRMISVYTNLCICQGQSSILRSKVSHEQEAAVRATLETTLLAYCQADMLVKTGRAIKIQFEAGSTGPNRGRDNTEAESDLTISL